jgi:hypothetical protein
VQAGERCEVLSVASDHWVHGFAENLVPLLAPHLDKHGERDLLKPFDDSLSCSEHAAAIASLHLAAYVDSIRLDGMLALLIPHNFKPSRFVALSFIQCDALQSVFGSVLHQLLRDQTYSRWFGAPLNGGMDLLQDLKEEMITTQALIALQFQTDHLIGNSLSNQRVHQVYIHVHGLCPNPCINTRCLMSGGRVG